MAAIEFALVLPVLITAYFGLVAASGAVGLSRKVGLVSRTVSDLLGRATASMDCPSFKDGVGAATAVVAPYDPTGLTISVASVTVDNSGVAKVLWSQARALTSTTGQQSTVAVPSGWAEGSTVTPPTGFAAKNGTFFLTKVTKDYTPVIGSALIGTVHLAMSIGWPIRNSQPVTWSGTKSCP